MLGFREKLNQAAALVSEHNSIVTIPGLLEKIDKRNS